MTTYNNPADLSNESSTDPLPDPEPSVPSLSEPDPGVFHHEPGAQEPNGPPLGKSDACAYPPVLQRLCSSANNLHS